MHIIERSTVEDRRSELAVKTTASPCEDSLEDLTEVHSRRHTEGVQTEVDRRTICEEGHILLADDLRDDTLVTVTTCHLITDLDLTLLSDVDLSHLDDTRRQLIAHRLIELLTAEVSLVFLRLLEVVRDHLGDELVGMFVARPAREDDFIIVECFELRAGELRPLADLLDTEEVLHAVLAGLTRSELEELVDEELTQLSLLAFSLLFEDFDSSLQLGAVLLSSLRVEFGIDDDTTQRRRSLERSILHVTSLITEDSTQELFFWRRIGLTLRRDLTDQDIAWLDACTDADDTILIEVLRSVVADIGDIAGKLFETALGLTHFEGVLIDVNRGKEVFTDEAFVEHNRILIVVTLPRHVSHLDVATESKLTSLSGVPFGEDIASFDTLSLEADRTEVDRGALVGLAELRQAVGRDGVFEANEDFIIGTVVADLNRGSVDEDDFASALCYDLRT